MISEKEKYYEESTRALLATIEKMNLEKIRRIRAKNLVRYFRDSFKLENVKYQTFWTDLGESMKKFTYDSDGFCRAASVNFALMMGGAPEWKLMFIDDLWAYGPHHYLLHAPSKTILDLTYDQYTNVGIGVPYQVGKHIKLDFTEDEIESRFAKALNLGPVLASNQKG